MRKSLTTLLVVGGISAVMADTSVNTGTAGLTSEIKYPWKHSVSVGVTLTRGNSQTALFTADFLATKKTLVNEYSLGLAGAYGNNNSTETINNYKVFGQWNHLFSERLYSYVRASGLRDVIQNIDYRLNVGPGAGYYFIKDSMTYLAGEAGVGFEAQRFNSLHVPAGPPPGYTVTPAKEETFATIRLADRFEHKFNDHARFWQSAEFLPQVDKFDNFVVNFEAGVETSVTKSFTLKTYVIDSYQNRPSAGKLKNDVQIVAAVGYKF